MRNLRHLTTTAIVLGTITLASFAFGQTPMLVPYEQYYGSSFFNPDSVRVDTNSLSPTFKGLYAKGDFRIKFLFGSVLPLDSVNVDSNLVVAWESIDSSYPGLLSAFSYLEDQFGSYTLKKKYPNFGDTNSQLSMIFHVTFDSEVCIDTVLSYLNTLDLKEAIFMEYPCQQFSIPNAEGMIPGFPISDIYLNPSALGAIDFRKDMHKLGLQWNLYKLHCPMAWEITQGSSKIFILEKDLSMGGLEDPLNFDAEYGDYLLDQPDLIRGFKRLGPAPNEVSAGVPTLGLLFPNTDLNQGNLGQTLIGNAHGFGTMTMAVSGKSA